MYLRSKSSLPQLRKALLSSASAAALCIGIAGSAAAGGFTVEAEGTWLQHFGDDVVYSDFQDAVAATSNNQTIDREKDLLGRGQVIWHFNDWFSISAGAGTGTFENETTSPYTAQGYLVSYMVPQILTVPGNLTLGCADVTACSQVYSRASAQLDTDIDFADFDIGADVGIGRYGQARFFAGARYVRFGETLRGSYTNDDPSTYYRLQTLRAERDSTFTGWGPRIGFTADVPIGSSGFSFGGTVAGAALFGNIDTTVGGTHQTTYNQVRSTDTFSQTKSTSQTAFSIELSPQVSYSLVGENISARISAGYRFDQYLGITDTETGQTYLATIPAGEQAADVKFDGPFLRIGVTFGSDNSWAKKQ